MSKHEDDSLDSNYWSTKRVDDLMRKVEDEGLDYKSVDNPFHDGDPSLKRSNLLWEYTPEELQEMQKCALDVVHFAQYCQVMTDDGLQYIRLRDYQESVLREYQNNRFNIFLAPRQVGKCLLPTSVILNEENKKIPIFNFKEKNNNFFNFSKSLLYFIYWFFIKKKSHKKKILKLISFIEKFQFKNYVFDQDDPEKKVINEYEICEEILSDSGYVTAHKYLETQPYEVWFLELENGKSLECADLHILFDENFNEVLVKNLVLGNYVMTDEGPSRITYIENSLIKVSMADLSVLHHNHRYYSNGILSHNSITSSIILVWYLLFNHDKNAMILANVGSTAEELVDKIKAIVKGLPWFLKPGMIVNNVMSMKFDNGCRAIAKTTTKTTAIGFTIHFLYMDEFAHIHPNFIESFFRSSYPTVSSSKVSRIIITSTPNGMNKFYEIYHGALSGENSFNPVRVDWWQVPGRDEEWKKQEIANLGSEELFNQEYGNQFLSSTSLLLGSNELKKIKSNESEYVWREIDVLSDLGIFYENFRWHPKFSLDSASLDDKNFVLSVDLAGGGRGDFTVINIFRVVPLPKKLIESIDDFKDEGDFFSLLQVGVFRDNGIQIEDIKKMIEALILNVFNKERLTVLLEMNFRGELLLDKLISNDEISLDMFLHTKHTESARTAKPGIKYNEKNKMKYCEILRASFRQNRVIVNEKAWTIPEIFSFGLNNSGTYSSQSGHDDVAMTLVNLSALFETTAFYDLIGDLYDRMDEDYRKLIETKLNDKETDGKTKEGSFYNSFSKLMS